MTKSGQWRAPLTALNDGLGSRSSWPLLLMVITSEELGAQEMPRVHLESCGLRHLSGGEHPPS